MYYFVGRKAPQATRAFFESQRDKYEAITIPQGSERGDFRALFADFGDMSQQQIKEVKRGWNEQFKPKPEEPMRVDFDFTVPESEEVERPRPVGAELKYHVVTDQQMNNIDVTDSYNRELGDGKRVAHLFSTMAHLMNFYLPNEQRPYRVFVWKGQHAENAQVFTQGSQFWVNPAARELFEKKMIRTSTEEEFDESAEFLEMFDVLVYHLGQFKEFNGNRRSWTLDSDSPANSRERIRVFKVFRHFNARSKICF